MTKLRIATAVVINTVAAAIIFYALLFAWNMRGQMVTQQRRAQILRDMIATTEHGLVILDPSGKIVEWGDGAERIFGYQSYEVIGRTPGFLMPEDMRARHFNALKARQDPAVLTRNLVTVDCWALRKCGEYIAIRIVASSFRNHRGVYHMALITDVPNVAPAIGLPAKPDASCEHPSLKERE